MYRSQGWAAGCILNTACSVFHGCLSYETVREVCRCLVARLCRAGLAALDLDVDVEAMALHGLVGGLGVHLLISPGFKQQAL